jgi:hypothetical protein
MITTSIPKRIVCPIDPADIATAVWIACRGLQVDWDYLQTATAIYTIEQFPMGSITSGDTRLSWTRHDIEGNVHIFFESVQEEIEEYRRRYIARGYRPGEPFA